ncbi:shikimate kinase [Candidatus Gracilibacteria bacterium]|nr:shikimate kinase [Candidatus Gracilibacteria bacterium]
MNLVLIGLRGSGKSKLGKMLAKKLHLNFIDIDHEIEELCEQKIPLIIGEHGWPYFRKKEKEVVEEVSKLNHNVIATGGGSIIDPENAKNLRRNSKTVYLHISAEKATKRIKNSTNRPALTHNISKLKEMQQLYEERHHIYEENADIIFKRTDDLEEDSEKIIDMLSNNS